jgi:CheY-like chemotaxis protein
MDAALFPDLDAERERLAFARRCREESLARFRRLLEQGSGAADQITDEYVEVTLLRAVADLEPEDAADFFGRIDTAGEVLRIGRRHVEDGRRSPVVLDWRAPAAAAFYRATLQDPFGLTLRRRYSLVRGELVSYSDEHLENPSDDEVVGGIPDPVLAEIGAARTGAMREVVATIQAEQDLVIRAPAEQALVVQGGPGTGKTAVGLHRAAYLLFEHRERLEREGVLVVGPNRVFLDYIAGVLPSLGERSVHQQSLPDLLRPRLPMADGVSLSPDVVALLGDARWVAVLERAALARLRRDPPPLRLAHGARVVRVEPEELVAWLQQGVAGRMPLNRRREGFRLLAAQEIGRRMTDRDGNRPPLPPEARKVIDRLWPVLDGLDVVRRLLTRPADLEAAAGDAFDAAELRRCGGRRRRCGPSPRWRWWTRPGRWWTEPQTPSATWWWTRPRT